MLQIYSIFERCLHAGGIPDGRRDKCVDDLEVIVSYIKWRFISQKTSRTVVDRSPVMLYFTKLNQMS